jgi:diguanylate cyclase (GGDEF)-like protein/PAS domain S-box-containing protein
MKNPLHSLLKRQLQRFANGTIPPLEEQTDFLRAINEAYWQFDEDRRLLEQSLELTSQELLEKNAELSHINTELEKRVAARTAELSRSEVRFRGLFEDVPISIWEEDFSAVRQALDGLRAAGVVDLSDYFDEHPEVVAACATQVKIVDVNRATLEMYGAASKAELVADLSRVLGPESLIPFKEELLALARGETSFENETTNYTLRGERRVISLRLNVAPGYEQTWAKVFVGISDITEHRKTEAALAVERDLLQALMDNIPDTIYFKDTASRFTRVNQAQARLLGVRTPQEALGKTDLDFQETDLARSFYKEEQRLFQTGESLINRIEFNPTPDGQPRWYSATKVPIKDQAGRVIGMVGISHDITQRTQAEMALQEAETKYRTLVEHMPAVIYVDLANESRNTIYINSQVQKLLGYSPEDWIAKPDLCIDIIHPEDSERVWTELDASEARGRFACDYRYIARDGRIVWVRDEAVLIKNEGERPSVWQGVMLDMTAQKEAEEALRQSEERFRLTAWATSDAMWDWDLQTNQIWWGEGLQKVFHYSSETTPPDPEWRQEHIHPDDRGKVNRVVEQALEGGMEFWSKEYRFQRKDGTYADIMDRGYILRDGTGKPRRMIGAMLDITERKHMESTLQQANEQMGQVLHELQLRNREIVLLNEMSRLLQACQTVEEAYQIIANLSNQLFPQTTGALYLLNPTRTSVSAVASWGELPAAEQTFAPNDCWGLRHGRTHPLSEDQGGLQCLHLSEPLPAVSYCLPVQIQGEILGILHIRSQHKEDLDATKFQLAYTVVDHTGMALSNLNLRAALREQSIRDPITGLYNRRYMEEALKQHLSRVTRHLHPLGIVMIDIDHFKNFNDLHGHAAGDQILRELGKFLQSHVRGEDTACRYGGEEFILIMPDVFLEAVKNRAEQLRRAANELRVEDAGQLYAGITLSMGVALYPVHGRTIENVLRAADSALYRAKQEGRDRVVIADTAH